MILRVQITDRANIVHDTVRKTVDPEDVREDTQVRQWLMDVIAPALTRDRVVEVSLDEG